MTLLARAGTCSRSAQVIVRDPARSLDEQLPDNVDVVHCFHPDLHVRFRGMVDDHAKAEVLARSRGCIFPVTWHEPFGLAVVESLYYGSPVFGTPYGALPELVPSSLGVLSASSEVLADGVRRWETFDPEACHAHAREQFGARRMARDYLGLYEEVAGGATLNPELAPVEDRFRDLPWH
jgi:glycosyltransferase involved in cell wall biosynthesis